MECFEATNTSLSFHILYVWEKELVNTIQFQVSSTICVAQFICSLSVLLGNDYAASVSATQRIREHARHSSIRLIPLVSIQFAA